MDPGARRVPAVDPRPVLLGRHRDGAVIRAVVKTAINDYAWDEKYSRSIGVDIRYILWFVEKFGGADHLIEEMMK